MEYQKMVKSVGDLILMGVWYSDACEVITRFAPPVVKEYFQGESSGEWWDSFEESVNFYLHDKNVPTPNYKPIY
tara:strand:+ start:1364 stop:1585 length:222 start_codon:yes stop_codon:yes gene_type:complete